LHRGADIAALYGATIGADPDGAPWPPCEGACIKEVVGMQALYTVIVFVFVIGVLAVAAFAVFELTPFARHKDRFRDPRTGKRLGESPRLD
jgi:hypothetical protein